MSDTERTRRFFDAIAPRYDRVFARSRDELAPRMERLLALLGAARDVLDLGVGTGRELPGLLDAGHRVVGVDLSERMIALCRQRSRPIRCVQADFWAGLPLADRSFDAVVALFGTLAHAPDAEAHARLGRELVRVLRPCGLFFAEVPTPAWAAQNRVFRDAPSGESVEVVAPSAAAWRAALAPLEVTISEAGAELAIVGRAPEA